MPADPTSSAEQIGHHFNVASFVPTVVVLGFIGVLLASGPPNHAPDVTRLRVSLHHVGFQDAIIFGFASIGVALIANPFQFALIQFFEGYWPETGPFGLVTRTCRDRHRRRWLLLNQARQAGPVSEDSEVDLRAPSESSASVRWEGTPRQVAAAAAFRELPDIDRTMPTSLGNALRYAEDYAGGRYGLDTIEVIPRLYPLMPSQMVLTLDDSRQQLELAVRFAASWLIATPLIGIVLYEQGWWLLLAVGAYGLSWISYNGAVQAARRYGETMVYAVDLYRFRLIEQLRLELPATLEHEVLFNKRMMRILHGDHRWAPGLARTVRYRHPPTAPDA